jgi:hypothetical protein
MKAVKLDELSILFIDNLVFEEVDTASELEKHELFNQT